MRRKRGLIFLAVGIALALSIYLYFFIRNEKSFQEGFPASAETVVRINVDQLIWKGVKHVILHPSEWGDFQREKKKKEERKAKGFDLPANVFLYTLTEYPSQYFATFLIRDKDEVGEYLIRNYGFEEQKIDGISIFTLPNKKIKVGVSSDKMVVRFAEVGVADQSIMDVLKLKISPNEDLIHQLKQQEGDVGYLAEGGEMELEIDGNYIHFHFIQRNRKLEEAFPFFKSTSLYDFSFFNRVISSPWNIEAYIEGVVSKTDTVVTYEYDDNFEQTEVKELVSVDIPGVYAVISWDSAMITDELEHSLKGLSELLEVNDIKTSLQSESMIFHNILQPKGTVRNSEGIHVEVDMLSLFQSLKISVRSPLDSIKSVYLSGRRLPEMIEWEGSLEFNSPILELISDF